MQRSFFVCESTDDTLLRLKSSKIVALSLLLGPYEKLTFLSVASMKYYWYRLLVVIRNTLHVVVDALFDGASLPITEAAMPTLRPSSSKLLSLWPPIGDTSLEFTLCSCLHLAENLFSSMSD